MKKFRLTATILAFALVLGIMGFGVYAATSPTFQISNQILFTPASGQAYFSAALSTQSKSTVEAAEGTWAALDGVTTIATDPSKPDATVTTGAAQEISDFNFATNHMYRISIVVTNTTTAADDMSVVITNLPIVAGSGFSVTASDNMAISGTTATLKADYLIDHGQSATITLTYQITDFTASITVDQNITVTISVPTVTPEP